MHIALNKKHSINSTLPADRRLSIQKKPLAGRDAGRGIEPLDFGFADQTLTIRIPAISFPIDPLD